MTYEKIALKIHSQIFFDKKLNILHIYFKYTIFSNAMRTKQFEKYSNYKQIHIK